MSNMIQKLNKIKPLTQQKKEQNFIKITPELRDYIELLNYEATRYEDLLNCVNKSYMTEKEYLNSYKYYFDLCEEAKLKKQFALEEIKEIYKDQIGDNIWYINFEKEKIVIGEDINEVIRDMTEDYGSYITRLYSNGERNPIEINSDHVKDITLQVTDACNMACTYCY